MHPVYEILISVNAVCVLLLCCFH